MIDYHKDPNYQQPFYTISGRNHLRVFSIIALILTAIGCFILVYYTNYFMMVTSLYSLFLMLLIKFPTINLYNDHFEVVRKSLYSKFSEKEAYQYKDIKSIRYSPGFTNWGMLILTGLLGGKGATIGDHERYSKSDSIILTMGENEKIEINRIGTKDNFAQAAELIKKKVLRLSESDSMKCYNRYFL